METETIEQTFNVTSPARIRVSNTSGSVTVKVGQDDRVHVQAIKHTERGDANRTTIELLQAEDGSISISTRFPELDFGWLFGSQICEVDYFIQAPRASQFNINGVSQSVHAEGFEGEQHFKSVSGEFLLHNLTGKISVDTVSGDVNAGGLQGEGAFKSVSGDVRVLQSHLQSNRVVTVSGEVSLQTGISALGPYRFETVSGDVHLQVPTDSHCSVELHSLSGDFATDLPANGLTRNGGKLTASLGGGGALVSLHSVSGDLSVSCQEAQTGVHSEEHKEVDSQAILTRLEKGEISVDEAITQMKG